jgi:hypothetical protein
MKRVFLFWLASAAALVLSPFATQAAVFSHDWKTPGDGLLTYDDLNQREWLDLTVTRLAPYPGITFEEKYQALLSELASTGSLDGFNIAQKSDLTALAISAGINVASLDDFAHNSSPAIQLMELVGISVHFANTSFIQSFGALDEVEIINDRTIRSLGIIGSAAQSGANGQAGLLFAIPGDLAEPATTGVWLFRPIPEPSNLSACSLFAFLCWARHLAQKQRCAHRS